MSTQFVVMGVSGSGKSTLAEALAVLWDVPFVEGDELHSAVSVAKMAAGVQLEDEDRWPWLDRVGSSIVEARQKGRGAVATCSALRLVYRDRLRAHVGQHLRFVFVDLTREILETRMQMRVDHYMPPSLLDSQLKTLERPDRETDVLIVAGEQPLQTILGQVAAWRYNVPATGET